MSEEGAGKEGCWCWKMRCFHLLSNMGLAALPIDGICQMLVANSAPPCRAASMAKQRWDIVL